MRGSYLVALKTRRVFQFLRFTDPRASCGGNPGSGGRWTFKERPLWSSWNGTRGKKSKASNNFQSSRVKRTETTRGGSSSSVEEETKKKLYHGHHKQRSTRLPWQLGKFSRLLWHLWCRTLRPPRRLLEVPPDDFASRNRGAEERTHFDDYYVDDYEV